MRNKDSKSTQPAASKADLAESLPGKSTPRQSRGTFSETNYDAPEIKAHSRALGHVPLIEPHPRTADGTAALKAERRKRIALRPADQIRSQQRAAAERVIANFKDNVAGRLIRLRGPDKIACHIMFSLLAAILIRLVQ